MAFLKIVAVALLVTIIISTAQGSLIAPLPAAAVRYTQVAPPSVLPFAAQVSAFTRNLHVFDAPYAAGVIPGPPPIVQRALLPSPVAPAPFAPSSFAPVPFAPAPLIPRAAPVLPNPFAYHYPYPYPALAPGPLLG